MREALGLEAIPNKFLSPRGDSSSDDEDSDRESVLSSFIYFFPLPIFLPIVFHRKSPTLNLLIPLLSVLTFS